MNDRDLRRSDRASRVQTFGRDNAFEFPVAFRFPADYSESTAITYAESLLKLLEGLGNASLQNKFIAFEIRTDFVEDLRADLDALNERNSGKHSDNQEGVENTSAIDTLLGQAQSIITRLDAIIRNKFSSKPDKLLAWKSASHTECAAKKAEPAAPVTVA